MTSFRQVVRYGFGKQYGSPIMTFAAFLASYIAAKRSMRMDPLEALGYE
jgi:hypothetical protein